MKIYIKEKNGKHSVWMQSAHQGHNQIASDLSYQEAVIAAGSASRAIILYQVNALSINPEVILEIQKED